MDNQSDPTRHHTDDFSVKYQAQHQPSQPQPSSTLRHCQSLNILHTKEFNDASKNGVPQGICLSNQQKQYGLVLKGANDQVLMNRTSSTSISTNDLGQQRFNNSNGFKTTQTSMNMEVNDETIDVSKDPNVKASNQSLSTAAADDTEDDEDADPMDDDGNDEDDYDDEFDDDDLLNDFNLYDYDQQDNYDIDFTINKFNPDDINLNYFLDYPEKYENPSINLFEYKMKNPSDFKDNMKENSENFSKFIQDYAHRDMHNEDWLLKCENLFNSPEQVSDMLAYIRLKKQAKFSQLVNCLIDWSIECIDLYGEVYSHGSKYLAKKFTTYKMFKVGVNMCMLLVCGVDEATCEQMLNKYQIQNKILKFFDEKHVYTPIKSLLMKLLDCSLYFTFGMNSFLGWFFV